jgi:hypothetical protein
MEGKQGSESRSLVHLCSHGWRVKNLTGRSASFSTKAGRLHAPETSKCLASFMPVGDERSTVESHPRCGGGSAFVLPFGCGTTPSGDASSGRPPTLRMIALDTLSVRERFGCFDHTSLSPPLQSCSVSAPISRTDSRRSSLYRAAAELSGDDTGAPTDRARTIGRGGSQLCTQHSVGRPPFTGLSPHHAGGEGVSISATTPSGESRA